MCVIADYVNSLQYHHGVAPAPDPILRAVTAAWLLHNRLLNISTITQGVVLTGSSRPSVEAALTILQSEDDALLANILWSGVSLSNAAAQVKRRAKLIASFKAATPEDRAAFGKTIGIAEVWDSAISPSI
jgi:aminoglycoside phosphotransferase family enzyme